MNSVVDAYRRYPSDSGVSAQVAWCENVMRCVRYNVVRAAVCPLLSSVHAVCPLLCNVHCFLVVRRVRLSLC